VNDIDYGPFSREEDDLVFPLTVSYPQAVLGADFEIPAPDGEPVSVQVPQGTPAGSRIRVRNRGIGRLDRRGRGDLLVEVGIHVPGKVKRKEKELLKELEESPSFRNPGK